MARKSKAVESATGSVGDWEREFERWLAPFLTALGRKKQRKWAPVYM